jgi:hypothetical protein
VTAAPHDILCFPAAYVSPCRTVSVSPLAEHLEELVDVKAIDGGGT